jgi:hypothetical protein
VLQLPPDISLRFEDRPGYLYAEVTGPRDSMQISLAYWAAISAQCKARSVERLMVVERLGDYQGERDMPRMIAALVAMGLDRIKVAFVVHRVELLPTMEHGEILAMEYGANGRVFSSADLAERWLRHGGS